MDGVVPELANSLLAAQGKIRAEGRELEISGILADWKDTIIEECMEDKQFCAAVRKKSRNLCGCMAALIQFSFENKVRVSDKIVSITTVKHNGKMEPLKGPLYLGIPNRVETRKIIRDYYLG